MDRRNADKYMLIEMVHRRPILWDSSLPNFKGAENEKSHAWKEVSSAFNMTPQRAERSFKSLRESYRRELATQKQLGSSFRPKWEYFAAMDFLRNVIRERKSLTSFDTKDEFAFYVQPKGLNECTAVPVTSTSQSSSGGSQDNIASTTANVNPNIKTERNHHHDDNDDNYDDVEVEELTPIDEDYPFPDIQLINGSHERTVSPVGPINLKRNATDEPKSLISKRKRSCEDEMIVTSNNNNDYNHHNERAEFHDRFGNFVAAKLNTLNHNDANDLMNKIFMILLKH